MADRVQLIRRIGLAAVALELRPELHARLSFEEMAKRIPEKEPTAPRHVRVLREHGNDPIAELARLISPSVDPTSYEKFQTRRTLHGVFSPPKSRLDRFLRWVHTKIGL